MPKPLRAILFDLDNTLFPWDPCDERGRAAAYSVLQQAIDVSFDRFMQLHIAARDHLKQQLHGQASNHNRVLFFKYITDRLDGKPHPALILEMHAQYWDAFFKNIQPHPDAIRVLSQLGETHKLALVSNHITQPQLEKITHLGFTPYFDAIITSEEVGVEKPDPRIFQLALDRLVATPDEAVMIGDHPRGDIEGAHLAGLRTIFMTEYTPGEPAPECADAVASQLADVPRILQRWNAR